MKKNLLFAAAALCAAFTASAAVEVGFLKSEALGLADKPTLSDNTLLCETENVAMYLNKEQECSAQNPDFNGMKYLIVDGETIALVQGIGGNSNPAGVNVNNGPAEGGCQYHLVVKKNGYLIIPSKISSNKNFYAYEGTFAGDMNLMAYTLGMEIDNTAFPDVHEAIYSLPSTDLGYFDMNAPTADQYLLGGTAIAWPIRIATQNPEAEGAGNGTGAIIFPVFADAVDYWVFATGSKMNTCGFIFVEAADPTANPANMPAVTVYGPERTNADTGEVTPAKSIAITGEVQGAGLDNVIANEVEDANAPMFNVLGQRVNDSYKGLVIKNGKKFINK